MRAMRTLCEMALAARESADRIHVKSPVEPGALASPCRMCDWSEVTLVRPAVEDTVGWGMAETLSFPAMRLPRLVKTLLASAALVTGAILLIEASASAREQKLLLPAPVLQRLMATPREPRPAPPAPSLAHPAPENYSPLGFY